MAKKILKILGYAAAALVFLVLFLYVTFPFQRLKRYMEEFARNRMRMELSIGTYDHGLSRHTFRNVRMVFPTAPTQKVEAPAPTPQQPTEKTLKPRRVLRIKELSIDVSLAKLLFKKTMSVGFNGSLASGTLSGGHLSQNRRRRVVSVKRIRGIRLGQLPLTTIPGLRNLLPDGLIVDGKLGGEFKISHGVRWQSLRGAIRLKISRVFFPLLPLKMGPVTFEIRDADAGTCEIDIETTTKSKAKIPASRRSANDVVIHFKKLRCDGSDLEIRVQEPSYIELATPLRNSTISLTLQIAPGNNKEFATKNPGIPPFVQNLKRQRKMTGDFFGIRIAGPLFRKPRVRMVRPRVRGSITKSNTRPKVRFKPRNPTRRRVINTRTYKPRRPRRVVNPRGMVIPRPKTPVKRVRPKPRPDHLERRPSDLPPDGPDDPNDPEAPRKPKPKDDDDEG